MLALIADPRVAIHDLGHAADLPGDLVDGGSGSAVGSPDPVPDFLADQYQLVVVAAESREVQQFLVWGQRRLLRRRQPRRHFAGLVRDDQPQAVDVEVEHRVDVAAVVPEVAQPADLERARQPHASDVVSGTRRPCVLPGGGTRDCGHGPVTVASRMMGLRSRPMLSISTSTTSPLSMNRGGVCRAPTPPGVPVTTTSPGRSSYMVERQLISCGIPKIISPICARCIVLPLRRVVNCAVSIAGTSSFVVIHGPNAPVWAKFLPDVI